MRKARLFVAAARQQLVIEERGGASGILAAASLRAISADGYTCA